MPNAQKIQLQEYK